MKIPNFFRMMGGLIARAGWAPISLFLLHVFLSRILNGYDYYPSLDIPMHLLGGVAIAYFLTHCFATFSQDIVTQDYRIITEFVFVASLTTTSAVVWEFAEFISDACFGTATQLGLHDTLLDMALGMIGGIVYLIIKYIFHSPGNHSHSRG